MANVTYIVSLKDRVSRVAQKVQQSFQNLQGQVDRLDTALSGIAAVAGGAALTGIFQLGAEIEQTQLFFNTLTGSVERGTKLFGELTQFANATPFSNQALNRNAQTLLAFGEDADSVADTLRMLGDVAGGDQERLGRLTLAFSQIQSTGRLMGQDLLQLINAGFNPLSEISDATGKSMRFLKDQMRLGNISASLVTKAFQRATGPGGRFHGLTEAMAKTLAGRWSTALGKARFLVGEFGLSLKGIFAPFLEGAIRAIELVSKYRSVIFPVAAALGTMVTAVLAVVAAVKTWNIVQGILNAVLAANPIILILTLLAGLISAIVVAYQNSEEFRKIVNGLWFALKEVGEITKEVASILLDALGPAVDVAEKAFDGFDKKLKDELINQLRRLWVWLIEVNNRIAELQKTVFGFFDIDLEEELAGAVDVGTQIVNKFKNLGQRIAKAYNEGLQETIANTADTAARTPTTKLDFGINSELKKLQAEGIVSGGGIRTFNININSLTGVNTLSTTNIEGGASEAGNAVVESLLRALADIKNVG